MQGGGARHRLRPGAGGGGSFVVVILLALLVITALGLLVTRLVRYISERRAVDTGSGAFKKQERAALRAARRGRRDAYLDTLTHVGLYQIVIIFVVASIGGLILETIWVYFDMGIWQRRYGMIWGPFSPLYGCGATILTLALWRIRKQPLWMIFVASLVLGSCLEQFAGVVMESGFNATSWSYEALPDAITRYVSLHMSFIWGLLGCVWVRFALPELLFAIGEPRHDVKVALTVVLTTVLVADALMTLYVVARKDARDRGLPPSNVIESYIDERYDDDFLSERFENLEFADTGADPGRIEHEEVRA